MGINGTPRGLSQLLDLYSLSESRLGNRLFLRPI